MAASEEELQGVNGRIGPRVSQKQPAKIFRRTEGIAPR